MDITQLPFPTYPKIKNIYTSSIIDGKRILNIGHYGIDEATELEMHSWYVQRKLHGTNIRVICYDGQVDVRGRKDTSELPKAWLDEFRSTLKLNLSPDVRCIFFCEGIGKGIQANSTLYCSCPDTRELVCYDVMWLKDNDTASRYLTRAEARKFAESNNIQFVPEDIRVGISRIISNVAEGYISTSIGGHTFVEEGYVIRPSPEVLTLSGERIILKVKSRDFYPEFKHELQLI